MALPGVIGLLFLVALLSTSATFLVVRTERAGALRADDARLVTALDAALVTAAAGADPTWRLHPVGEPVPLPAVANGRVAARAWTYRLGTSLHWVVAEVSLPGYPAPVRRRAGQLVRVDSAGARLIRERGWAELY